MEIEVFGTVASACGSPASGARLSALVAAILICASMPTISVLLCERRYESNFRLLAQAINTGNYKDLAIIADSAFRLREQIRARAEGMSVPFSMHQESMDQRLALSLVMVGKYDKARRVIETMPPIEDTPWEREYHHSFIYRRLMLGQALLGAHEYLKAVQALQPALVYRPSDVEVQCEFGQAKLAMGQPEEAFLCFMRAQSSGGSVSYLKLCSDLAGLDSGDEKSARRLTERLISFWSQFEQGGGREGIAGLEFASDFMQQKGFIAEALDLKRLALKFKNRTSIL